jgi:hypothetical protein
MKVEQCTNGAWSVVDPAGVLIAAGVTNATAWSIADDEAIDDEETHQRVVAAFQW